MIKLKVLLLILLFIEDQKDFKTIEEIRNITSINSIPPTGEKETAGERGHVEKRKKKKGTVEK